MSRLFLFVMMLVLGYAQAAYAGTAASNFSVSVTVVKPGTLSNTASQQPSTAGNASLNTMNASTTTTPYERFSSTDSASKRGGLFP